MNPPSYPEVVGHCPLVDSHRNAARLNEFAIPDSSNKFNVPATPPPPLIKHIFFLANHSRLDYDKTVTVHGNMFLFNYAGHPTVTSGVSPKTIMHRFIDTLPSHSDANRHDLTRPEVYARVNYIKNTFLGQGSPLSLYSHGDVIRDMIVLDGGEVFDDEITMSEDGVRTLKWNPASFWVYESNDGNMYDLLQRNPQFKDVYEDKEYKSDFLVCQHNVCSTQFPPYLFQTRPGADERPVYLSDIFNLMRERVRTAIVLAEPVSIRDDALEEKVSKYMDDHVVFVNTGCRCVDGQYVDVATGKRSPYHRSVSSDSLSSTFFVTQGDPAARATQLSVFGFGGGRTGRKLRKKFRTGRNLARRKYKTKTIRRKTKHRRSYHC